MPWNAFYLLSLIEIPCPACDGSGNAYGHQPAGVIGYAPCESCHGTRLRKKYPGILFLEKMTPEDLALLKEQQEKLEKWIEEAKKKMEEKNKVVEKKKSFSENCDEDDGYYPSFTPSFFF